MQAALRHQMTDGEAKASPLRVLYAEDQTSARIVTTALLQKLGYSVDAVEDGELALHKAQETHYDVILLDIEMPVMDGATAAQLIRRDAQPCKDVPILALSAFLADSTEACSWRQFFDHALPKPATARELERAVSRVLEKPAPAFAGAQSSDLAASFRQVLPTTMWRSLATKAAEEMQALTLTISACSDAEDWDVLARTLRALKCLAVNFEARTVVQLVDGCRPGTAADGRTLSTHIGKWQTEALCA